MLGHVAAVGGTHLTPCSSSRLLAVQEASKEFSHFEEHAKFLEATVGANRFGGLLKRTLASNSTVFPELTDETEVRERRGAGAFPTICAGYHDTVYASLAADQGGVQGGSGQDRRWLARSASHCPGTVPALCKRVAKYGHCIQRVCPHVLRRWPSSRESTLRSCLPRATSRVGCDAFAYKGSTHTRVGACAVEDGPDCGVRTML